MADRKAVIKNADMAEDMQQDAIDCATQALEKYNIEKDIAAFIKKEFDKKYNPTWHAVVGRNFGSYVTHETKHFVYFYLGQVAILLFKSGWAHAPESRSRTMTQHMMAFSCYLHRSPPLRLPDKTFIIAKGTSSVQGHGGWMGVWGWLSCLSCVASVQQPHLHWGSMPSSVMLPDVQVRILKPQWMAYWPCPLELLKY